MLIHKAKKAVVLKLRNPARITTVIPTAIQVNDHVVAIPHRPDETRVLRNLGFEVPDPMPMHYAWPKVNGHHDPFSAQRATANFLAMHTRAFCLNGMGTGKTNSALWAYDYLRRTKQARRMLVVCPLSTMERTWADSVFFTFPHLDAAVLHGTRERRLKLLEQQADIYIINVDGLATIRDALAKRPDIDLIAVDELALARNASTERWKILNTICNKQHSRRVWGLTGSPTPNAPTDAWAQCRLVTPDSPNVPKYFGKFRDLVMRQISPFKWLPRPDAMETVHNMMQPSIRFALEDCVDLPEQSVITRDAQMSPEQAKAYKDMLSKLKADYQGGQILAVNEAVKANKLIQIACGVAYGTDGTEVALPCGPRLEVLRELIEESTGKVIVFVPITAALKAVAEELSKDWTVEVVHGETSKAERDRIFGEFQAQPDPRVLVANAGTMSHGLTLTAATTIVWYAPVHSNETYEQANARVRRPGQKRTTVIAHIASSDAERRVYKRLETKQSMQGVLLDLVREGGKKELAATP